MWHLGIRVSGGLSSAGLMLGLMNSQIFSNLNDSVLTQPASLIVHNKEATVYVQKVKVAPPAFPPDSSCIIWFLHCSSSTSKILTECSSWLPVYFSALFSETFLQLELVQKIQQAPEHAHTRFRRTVQVPQLALMSRSISKLHVVKLHLRFLCDSKQLEQHKREKHRWAQGGRAGATTPSSSAPGIPLHCPGMALSALLTFLLLNFKLARRACKFYFPSTEPALSETPELI